MRACTASRGANPSYKTLYMVPVTGMSTPRRCASRCTACVVLTPSATMHMDGSCFSCVLKIAFVFGVFGQPFTFSQLVPVVLVAVLSSVGMSGVPGGGYIGEYIICSIFFADHMEIAFPILVTIGNLVDPPATMINSAGDYVASFLVSRFVDGKNWLQRAGRQL